MKIARGPCEVVTSLPEKRPNGLSWAAGEKVDRAKVKEWVKEAVSEAEGGAATVATIANKVVEKHGTILTRDVAEAVVELAQQGGVVGGIYRGKTDQQERPEQLIVGSSAAMYTPAETDVVITRASAAQRGWADDVDRTFRLSGRKGAEKLVPLLKRIGSFYTKGAKSTINLLDLYELDLLKGGKMRIQLTDATPESMKQLGELFETLANVVKLGKDTKLRVIKYPTRPTEDGRVPWLDDDPHNGEDGYYYVPLVDLVSECEQCPAAADGILVWLPEERLFGYWQPDYSELWTWAGVCWSDIVADPLHFLNAKHPRDEFKPWPKYYTFG